MKHNTVAMVLALIVLIPGSMLAAQTTAPATQQTTAPAQGQSSLGDYAKKIRKEPAANAKPKVYDNDNLPTEDKLSVIGPKPEGGVATPSDSDKAVASPAGDEEKTQKEAAWKSWQGKLSSQKEQVDLNSRELDVLQREYQLRAAAMYGDAGSRLRNETSWDKQDAEYKQKIADKQKAVDEAKQKLTDMQEEARKAGVPAGMIE